MNLVLISNLNVNFLLYQNDDEARSRPWKVIDECCLNNLFYWTRANKHANSSDYELIPALNLNEENFRTIRLLEPSSYDKRKLHVLSLEYI